MAISFSEWTKQKKEEENRKKAASSGITSNTSASEKSSASPSTSTVRNETTKLSFSEWSKRKRTGTTAEEWANRSSSVLTKVQNYYSDWRNDSKEMYDSYTSELNELLATANKWRDEYADDEDALAYIDSVVDALAQGKSYAYKANKYWSQWDSEAAYKDSLKLNELQGMSAADLEPYAQDKKNRIAYTTSDGEEITWESLYNDKKKQEDFNNLYTEYSSKEDWKEMSKYKTTAKSQFDLKADGWYEDINKPMHASARGMAGGGSAGDTRYAQYMTDKELEIFNYIYNANGKKAAKEYYESIKDDLKRKAENTSLTLMSDAAKEYPVLMSGLSVATSLGSGVEYIGDLGKYAFTGEMDTNHMAATTNAIRGAVSDNTDWMIGNWDAHDFLYNTAMSGIDSFVAGATLGGAGAVALGLSAAAQGTNDALSRGLSDGQAFWNGLFSGVAEGLFEKWSIGNFKALKEVPADSVKTIIKNIGKSMLVNASEESLTEIANIAYDTLVNGEFANYTWDELKNGAWKQALAQVVESGASGALMGAGFGTAGSVAGYRKGAAQAKALYGNNPSALVSRALEIDPDNALANKLNEKINVNKRVPNGKLYQLAQQTVRGDDISRIQQATTERLKELGATENVETVAAALTKLAIGEELTKAEQTLIERNRYAPTVAEELNLDNIRSGDYSSEWTQKIDTRWINVDEYSRLVEAAQIAPETTKETDNTVPSVTQNVAQASAEETAAQEKTEVAEKAAIPAANIESVDDFEGEVEENGLENATHQDNLQVSEETSGTQEKAVSVEEASKKYGEQAGAMVSTYNIGGGKQDIAKFDAAYQVAYDMGKSGVSLDYVMNSESTAYLSEKQREFAHVAGAAAANSEAYAKDAANKAAANGKTGRKKGVVKGEGVSISDLKETFNDPQGRAYRVLSHVAEVTGIDIVLYRSKADADGEFHGAQGKYDGVKKPGTIYIDINAGLRGIKDVKELHRYAMLRTFSHEFTHFIERWNPVQYNEFRKVVFDTITERGENVHDLIEDIQRAKFSEDIHGLIYHIQNMDLGENADELIEYIQSMKLGEDVHDLIEYVQGMDLGENTHKLVAYIQSMKFGMSYDAASREVVAEAMVDVLPDANFVETLATKHKTIFEKLLEKLKEFVADIKEYFKTVGRSHNRGALALQEQLDDTVKYLDSIVDMFDTIAVQAVENYQLTVATEETTVSTTERIEATTEDTTSAEKTETVVEEKPAESVTETSPHGFTISDNTEYGSLEIKFSENPSDEVRHVLKENKFKWHKVKKVWFGYTDRKTITDALNGAYETVETVDEPETTVVENTTVEDVLVPATPAIRARAEEAEQLYGDDKVATVPMMDREYVIQHKSDGTYSAYVISRKREGAFAATEGTKDGFTSFADASEHAIRWILANDPEFKTKWKRTYAELTAAQEATEPVAETPERGDFEKAFWDATQAERDEVVEAMSQNTKLTHMAPTEIREQVIPKETVSESEADSPAEEQPKSQETTLDKRTVNMLKSFGKIRIATMGRDSYITNGAIVLPVNEADILFATTELGASSTFFNEATTKLLQGATTPIEQAPTEAKNLNKGIYIFDIDGKKRYFDKKMLSFLDGGALYYGKFSDDGGFIKSVNEDGSVKGYLLGMKAPAAGAVTDEKVSKLKSFAKKKSNAIKPTENTEGAITDGKESENGSDNGSVHEPVRGSEGTARLLEGVEPEAVRGSDEDRGTVRAGSDERTEDAGRDRRADAAGSVSERSPRDSVGGDLQQLSGVSETAADTNVGSKMTAEEAEQLHEEVQKEIEKKSTTNPKGSNFVIGDSLNLPNGTKARTRANIDAIKLVKQIAAENRIATAAEQEVLSKYVGWGGLADAFGKPVSNHTTRKIEYEAVKGLEAEFEELKSVLTEEEYKAARESTKNAHYTSIEVIKAMYDGLKQLGFTGGRMLEPSSGVGNFVGAMPADMTSQVKSWTMVELDNITGMLAKYLYPNADMRIQGFEEANIPDGYMDVAIGNVPFGNYAIADKKYPKAVTSAIHNYFFAKALDKVRPGGVVMFITSSYTMNGRDNAVRKYMMQRADLMGAIRLPNTAFSGNAGTSVVTDILVLKKREAKTEYSGEAFAESNWERMSQTGWEGAYVNEYFVQHPEMVLGEAKLTRGMYSANEMTVDPYTDRGPLGDQIREAFKNIKGKMEYSVQASAEQENIRQAIAKKKSQKLQVKDGVIQAKDENGNVYKVDVDKDTAERITGMVAIRDAHAALCDALQQGAEKKTINSLRKALNKAYNTFVDKYGYLNGSKNKRAINQFADRYAILSLENYNTEGKKITVSKSDIFSKDTIAANKTAASAENVEEGLTISLNTAGRVDVSMIARLTGQKVESVTRQLIDQRLVFKDKDGNLIPAVQYLSGNVRAKLREMEGLVGIDRDYQNNVEALREVVPPTVDYTDIYVNPGATWVPVNVYEDFVSHILNRTNHEGYRTGKKDFSVEYVPETNEYKVSINDEYAKRSAQNTQVWGESGKAFSTIFENMLNGRRTNVYKDAGDGKRVLDKAKTEAVAEKVEKLNEEFRKWLWADEARRGEMQEFYNESFNALVTPKYTGAGLSVNGLNSTYSLREHQKDAVARIINSGGNTLLAHRVGAGKTMEMAAAAMKLKQLGVIKKPMFVVPNNVVAQWGKEFKDYFPAANILLVGDDDMTAAERMTTINKIKNNDYDAVILAYTKFEKIQMTKAWRQKFYEEQIDNIMFAINAEKEAQKGKGFTVKQLEAKRKQLETKLKKLTDKAKDEDGAMFEDLGVDSLFVDEAHNFKNLEYTTRMTNVSGLSKPEGAQRSFDLYTKIRYLQQLNGGRGVVFATATPVMNSMTEMYIMQKYLQPDTLKQLGIDNFDSWAKMFGEVVNALEIAPSDSGYRLKQTFSKFKNVKALQQLFRSFTDVLTDVPGLKIPKMKGGKVQIVECEQGEFQKNYMAELAKRAENVKNVDPSEDNMLKITSDGRKISYSQRMIDPSLPYEETGKIYKCCENVYNVYKESNKTKGTQMIFCDMATPKGKSSTTSAETETDEFDSVDVESAQLYEDIKNRLVQLGVPAKEIAFIHDAKNDKQKAALSEKMNNGTIRVLLGSTGKMGVGLNAQVKAVAIHHLDAPWRPGDIEQRDGRVFRQKNENDEAYKFVYVTKGSFDSRLWDILERKQKFINQVMNGDDVGNEIEDTGEVTLSAAEVKAVASDNPLIMEQVALEKEISKLQSLQQTHSANVTRAEEKIVEDRRAIASLETSIENVKADIQNRKDTYSNDSVFSIQIGGQTFTDKQEAGVALMAAAQAKAVEGSYNPIGKFAGFTLRVVKTPEGIKGVIAGVGNYAFKTYPINTTYGINRLVSIVADLDNTLTLWNKQLTEAKNDLETQKKLAAEPFEQAEKLKEKRSRYNEIMYILNPPVEQNVSEDTVQEQSRKYLEDEEPKRYNKRSKYSETETLFLNWSNSSAPVGETKRFFRFGKIHYYEKTETGCVELSKAQFDERDDFDGKNADRRAEREIGEVANRDGGAERHEVGRTLVDKNAGRASDLSGQTLGEELRNDAAGSVSGAGRDDRRNAVTEQHQQRTTSLTDREVLEQAADGVLVPELTDAERDALNIFKKRLDRLRELEEQRAEQGRLHKEQQFGTKVDRVEAAKTLNRMHLLDDQIKAANDDVFDVEEKAVLRKILKNARKVVVQEEREHSQELLKRWRDRRNNAEAIKKYRDRLKGDVDELSNWILRPDNKNVVKHVPDALKDSVIPFLSSINFMSKRQLRGGKATAADKAFREQLSKLESVMGKTVGLDDMYANYNDLPPDFMDNMHAFQRTVQQIIDNSNGDFVINQMTSEELRDLSKMVRTLKKYIMQMNYFHMNAMFQHVSDAGDNSIDSMSMMKPAEHTGALSNFMLWQQMRPAFAFERFGKGGMSIYDGLRRGQATLAFNTQKIKAFSDKAYSAAEVKAWDNQVKTIQLGAGRVVKMKVSQIMSLYELNKREQAKGHIFGEGIRVATFKDGNKKISDVGQKLTPAELNIILKELTPRQIEVADKLQQYMQQQGGEWGNYVTLARFGEKQFGEENYFPINSDGRHLQVDADEGPKNAALYALLNMGFTKQTQEKAKNRLVVYSIFDVFSNHMASMAQYNAFALPVIDALKWFNYQQVEVDSDGARSLVGSVREQMDRVYGVPEETKPGSGRRGYAQNFVINIIKAFNGTEAQGTPYDSFGMQALHQYNRAQVAYNFRVVVQQPLAITRAAMLLDYRSILKGMKLSPAAIKRDIAEMREHSGIAAWKALGFYDVNISRGLTSIIKHDDNAMDKVIDFGMKGAEEADTRTWAAMWSACKAEVMRKQKLTPKDEGFYEAVTKLFEDVIYKTQVVDSVLTKNEFMRDKGFFARAIGSFMSEPTTTASMLVDAFDKFQMDMQRGMTRQQAWKKNVAMIGRTAYVYGVGAILLAAVQAAADALRDDDEYETYPEKWLEAFVGNVIDELMPFNKLPIVSDFYELGKTLLGTWTNLDVYGTAPNSVIMQWYDSAVKFSEILHDKIFGEDTNYTWYGGIYKLLQAASGIAGLPMAAATREIITAWNNTVGAMAPSLKVKSYDPGDKNEIKYAYQDGYLTADEATAELISKRLVDTEDEAYWLIQGWEVGDGYSRYDALYDAALSGANIDEAMSELMAHGYTKKDVLSQLKSQIGKWYYDDESKIRITKQQAIDMLTKYMDMDSDEITATVNKWSAVVVTGTKYDEIKDEYLDGNITLSRAIEMRVRYGGESQEKATETVNEWRAEKETGIAYGDIKEAFMDGEISERDAVNMYVTYGGYSQGEAEEKAAVLAFVRENPDCDGISYAAIENYTSYCEAAGVSAGTFYEAWKYNSETKADVDENGESISGSKKVKVLAYIDTLNLTYEQKDSLYYAFGWAESKIYEAPWH